MAEWRIRKLALPPGLQEAADAAAAVASAVATFLDAVSVALEVAAGFAQAELDAFETLVNATVDILQDFLNDFAETGVSVLVDYPQSLNLSDFNPVSQANLAGTFLDTEGFREASAQGLTRQNRLQAVAQRRKEWNPPTRDLLSYEGAISRITTAFDDPFDPLRPQFSNSANTVGVVLMAHSEELGQYLKLVKAFSNLFAIDDLDQLLWPDFESVFPDFKKAFADLQDIDYARLDLTAPFELRNAGRHPNFVFNSRLGDLIPGLGDAVEVLTELLEQFRPNGPLTEFIQDAINFVERKVQRLQDLIEELEEITEQLRNAFDGTEFASVVIESNTGNAGFKRGLETSTGHPEFDNSLVLSMVIYAGAASGRALKALFAEAGRNVASSQQEALGVAKANATRPVVRP